MIKTKHMTKFVRRNFSNICLTLERRTIVPAVGEHKVCLNNADKGLFVECAALIRYGYIRNRCQDARAIHRIRELRRRIIKRNSVDSIGKETSRIGSHALLEAKSGLTSRVPYLQPSIDLCFS